MNTDSNYWFHSAKPIKIFIVDYRLTIFLLFFFLHMRLWTFGLFIVMTVFFAILEAFNLDIINAFKKLRCNLSGKHKPIK